MNKKKQSNCKYASMSLFVCFFHRNVCVLWDASNDHGGGDTQFALPLISNEILYRSNYLT